ncbi:hypothetical protein PghCCS26_25210 [Paenibacillus glycanilyticus]|uniref:RNase H type-1 domain-containing protein n=1 Tax=Paenibacillus glycanilyticus TaxID=126569 RepID=A0ABQ6NKS3_9BACL|nr:hypothetical protein [Paenibacillus glycanilyticus]GMK45393.1 hypothetical protein PghCCS26_25210 [Paenibacillus glycanilyticus]
MDLSNNLLVKKAYASPQLRQCLLNKGTMFLYCDYAGFAAHNAYGAACCTVFNRTIRLSAKKLPIFKDYGSNYGEVLAIIFSLDTLTAAYAELEHPPKIAVVYTDCIRISHLLALQARPQTRNAGARNELTAALDSFNRKFPDINLQIKYISKHKKNNHLHRLAHNAAREAALSSILS